MTRTLATIMIGLFFAGCGKHYWEARGRGFSEFQTDSGQCIQEAKTKYEVSERIYRRCMRAQGWERIQTNYPSDRQFRGPEDEDEFFSPPNPLSERGFTPRAEVDVRQPPGGAVDVRQSPGATVDVPNDPNVLPYTQGECPHRGGRWVDGRCRR